MKSIEQYQLAKLITNTLFSIDESKKEKFLSEVAETIARIPSEKTRSGLLDAIQVAINEREGIIRAEITSAAPLGEKERKDLRTKVAKKYDAKDAELKERIDLGVIGGVKVRVRDEVYDATIQKSLRTLAEQLHA